MPPIASVKIETASLASFILRTLVQLYSFNLFSISNLRNISKKHMFSLSVWKGLRRYHNGYKWSDLTRLANTVHVGTFQIYGRLVSSTSNVFRPLVNIFTN